MNEQFQQRRSPAAPRLSICHKLRRRQWRTFLREVFGWTGTGFVAARRSIVVLSFETGLAQPQSCVAGEEDCAAGHIASVRRVCPMASCIHGNIRQYRQQQGMSRARHYTRVCAFSSTQMTSGVVNHWYSISYIFTWCLAPLRDASRWYTRSYGGAMYRCRNGGLQMAVSRRSGPSRGAAPPNGLSMAFETFLTGRFAKRLQRG